MKKLLFGACALTILFSMGCYSNQYYDDNLHTSWRNDQRADSVQRDLRMIPYDFDSIFGMNYSQNYNDYPTPNY